MTKQKQTAKNFIFLLEYVKQKILNISIITLAEITNHLILALKSVLECIIKLLSNNIVIVQHINAFLSAKHTFRGRFKSFSN